MNGHHLKLLKELSKNKIAYMYIMTPAGIKSKMQLSRHFLTRKLGEYEVLKMEIEELKREDGLILEKVSWVKSNKG